jgi:DNA-directed RNA polymerase subunit N (RpoN/RPB10)
MIIPVRCLSCGKVISDVYDYFKEEVAKRKEKLNLDTSDLTTINLNKDEIKKTIEGEVLDELGIIKDCCRLCIMTHIDFVN